MLIAASDVGEEKKAATLLAWCAKTGIGSCEQYAELVDSSTIAATGGADPGLMVLMKRVMVVCLTRAERADEQRKKVRYASRHRVL